MTKLSISRFCVGLVTLIAFSVPFMILSRLSSDVRNLDFIGSYQRAGSDFPQLSILISVLGPVDWWSYISPVFISIGFAFLVRHEIRVGWLILLIVTAVMQAILLIGAVMPYLKLYEMAGNLMYDNKDIASVGCNLIMVVLSFLFALLSIKRSLRRIDCEQVSGRNGFMF